MALSPQMLGDGMVEARGVADVMSAAWAQLARTGNPNKSGVSNWPRYGRAQRPTMVFAVQSRTVADPEADLRKLVRAYEPGFR